MSSITTIGGAIKALNNGQELLDGFRTSSKAFKKSEDAQSAFLETAEKLKTLLVNAGYNHELVSYNKPDANAPQVEQAFYAFVTDAAIQRVAASSRNRTSANTASVLCKHYSALGHRLKNAALVIATHRSSMFASRA
jgi:hypothetical protein